MPLEPRQYEYNGLVFGLDTPFRTLESVEGLSVSMPDVRLEVDDEPEEHGAFVDGEFVGARYILVPGILLPNGDLRARINEFRAAFSPRGDDIPLKFHPPEGDAEMRVLCRPTRRAGPNERIYMTGQAARWFVELVGADPRIYSEALRALVITPGTPPGGLTFDAVFDVNFGGGDTVSGNAHNAGTAPSPPFARIDGPVTNPKIQNDEADQHIQMGLSLLAGEWLDIDFKAKTILLNGTASRYGTLTVASQWFDINPGNNTIQFIVSGASGSTQLTLEWRDAWL